MSDPAGLPFVQRWLATVADKLDSSLGGDEEAADAESASPVAVNPAEAR